MQTLRKTRGRHLLTLVAMCGLISSALGLMTNVAGIFFAPIADELGRPTAAVNLALTISNLTFPAGGMLCARYVGRKEFRPVIVVSSLLVVAANALLAFCRSLPALYAANALRGFSAGFFGNVLVSTVIVNWFHSDTGFITSLALGCSGLVGALFNPLLDAVIRSAGWRAAYLTSAGLILLFNLPAMVLPIALRPEDVGLVPIGVRAGQEARGRDRRQRDDATPGTLILMTAMVGISLASLVCAAPQLLKQLAGTYGLPDTGILMMSVVLIMNTAGKFLFGIMTDRIGVRRSILIYEAIIASGVLLLLFVRRSGFMLLSAAMIGLCYALPGVGAVMICRELFSPGQYSRVFPKINFGTAIANAVGYPIFGAFYDRTGHYDGALVLIIALISMSAACVLLVYRMADRSRQAA